MSIEIERKYLLTDPVMLERMTRAAPARIEQGYLSLGTDTPWTTRVRLQTDPSGATTATLTAKSKGLLEREEVETALALDVARQLLAGCTHKISKSRYRHALADGLVAEVDVFCGAHEGLVIVEVELPTATTKTPFDGVLEDVTENAAYTNASLASSAAMTDRKPPSP